METGVPEAKAWVDTLEKELPKPMLQRAKKLADKRRANNQAALAQAPKS